MINLTDEERRKFAAWLMQEAHSNDVIIKQMEKLPGLETGIKKYRLEAAAYLMIARRLESTEKMTIKEGGI